MHATANLWVESARLGRDAGPTVWHYLVRWKPERTKRSSGHVARLLGPTLANRESSERAPPAMRPEMNQEEGPCGAGERGDSRLFFALTLTKLPSRSIRSSTRIKRRWCFTP